MTLTFKTIVEMLSSYTAKKNLADTQLFYDMVVYNMRDQPILQLNDWTMEIVTKATNYLIEEYSPK